MLMGVVAEESEEDEEDKEHRLQKVHPEQQKVEGEKNQVSALGRGLRK